MHSDILLVGMDGASLQRIVHRIKQNPRLYLTQTPIIIPMLGAHPHGSHHILNGLFRQWWPFIGKMALLVNNRNVVKDPDVSHFNAHEYFFAHVLGRACAEYIVEICATGTDYRRLRILLAAADANPNHSFSLVLHFVSDALLLFVQTRDQVRTNDHGKALDICWAEALTVFRATGKTVYSQLSANHVYWSTALAPMIQELYAAVRTMRYVNTHVGWDMFVEKVNALIRRHCVHRVSRDSILEFLRTAPFGEAVDRGCDDLFGFSREGHAQIKDASVDVEKIKEFLRSKVGRTYADAIRPRPESNSLDLDLSDWGGRPGRMHPHMPWVKAPAHAFSASHNYRAWLINELHKLSPWHQWQP